MRKSLKGKVDVAKTKPAVAESDDNQSEEEVDKPSQPSAPSPVNQSTKSKRKSRGKVAGPRSKRRKVDDEEEEDVESNVSVDKDQASSESEEEDNLSAKKMKKANGRKSLQWDNDNEGNDEKSDVSDEEIPLSKKMKAVKKPTAKNGLTKGKKRAAELEKKIEYEVESVVGCRSQRGKRQFRIRWKGFNEEDDTWENEDGLECTEAIEEYLKTHPETDEPTDIKTPKSMKKADKIKAKIKVKDEQNENGSGSEEDVSKEEYEVDRIRDVFIKKNGKREFLIRWKGYGVQDDTWEPEEHLNCSDLIKKFEEKIDKAKSVTAKELRVSRKPTERFTLTMVSQGRRLSRRGGGKQRIRYDDAE